MSLLTAILLLATATVAFGLTGTVILRHNPRLAALIPVYVGLLVLAGGGLVLVLVRGL